MVTINSEFNEMIRETKKTLHEIARLEDAYARFYERFMSIPGIVYGERPHTQSDPYHNPNVIWLDKMMETEKKIKELEVKLVPLDKFVATLSEQEKLVMNQLVMNSCSGTELAKQMKVSRTRVYEIKNIIIRKWMNQ